MLDELDVFETHVRERAFRLWQEAGCPENSAEEFWYRAREIEMREFGLTQEDLDELEKKNQQESGPADFA